MRRHDILTTELGDKLCRTQPGLCHADDRIVLVHRQYHLGHGDGRQQLWYA